MDSELPNYWDATDHVGHYQDFYKLSSFLLCVA